MSEVKFNLLLAMAGWFIAVQVAALVVCLALSLWQSLSHGIWLGVVFWAIGQVVIIVAAVVTMPLGALIRMLIGRAIVPTRRAAMIAGGLVGAVAAVAFTLAGGDPLSNLATPAILCAVAGVVGGWAWWRFEDWFLHRQERRARG